MQPAIFCSHCL